MERRGNGRTSLNMGKYKDEKDEQKANLQRLGLNKRTKSAEE